MTPLVDDPVELLRLLARPNAIVHPRKSAWRVHAVIAQKTVRLRFSAAIVRLCQRRGWIDGQKITEAGRAELALHYADAPPADVRTAFGAAMAAADTYAGRRGGDAP